MARRARKAKTRRPVMVLLELLGRRWALRVLWELRGEALTFRALRAACADVSPTSLNHRLADLGAAGIVEHGEGGYRLTRAGRRLLRLLLPINAWAQRNL
jgi:DNA-binding HxlR family transcriptional regulator